MIDRSHPDFVEALARGLAVIEAFDGQNPEMTLAEIARRVNLSAATVRRTLLTLEFLGFVRTHRKRFLLAPRVLTLGSAYLKSMHIEEAVMPELHRITELFGDAANMSILDGANILYIAHVSIARGARQVASLGTTYPAFPTSMGRVLLAALPSEQLDRLLATGDRRKLTEHTVIDEGELKAILGEVRAKGYAVTVDQLDYGITALAVPVTDPAGRTVAAINTSGYTPRLAPDTLIEQRLAELRISAGRITQLFSRHPTLLNSLI